MKKVPVPEYFTHLSNGDFCCPVYDMNHLQADIDFELNQGGQKYILITKRPISVKRYADICKILEDS